MQASIKNQDDFDANNALENFNGRGSTVLRNPRTNDVKRRDEICYKRHRGDIVRKIYETAKRAKTAHRRFDGYVVTRLSQWDKHPTLHGLADSDEAPAR